MQVYPVPVVDNKENETFSEFTQVTEGTNIDGLMRINNTLRQELE
jgi:hypothetical protein